MKRSIKITINPLSFSPLTSEWEIFLFRYPTLFISWGNGNENVRNACFILISCNQNRNVLYKNIISSIFIFISLNFNSFVFCVVVEFHIKHNIECEWIKKNRCEGGEWDSLIKNVNVINVYVKWMCDVVRLPSKIQKISNRNPFTYIFLLFWIFLCAFFLWCFLYFIF